MVVMLAADFVHQIVRDSQPLLVHNLADLLANLVVIFEEPKYKRRFSEGFQSLAVHIFPYEDDWPLDSQSLLIFLILLKKVLDFKRI